MSDPTNMVRVFDARTKTLTTITGRVVPPLVWTYDGC
jgi:hypothetical protein